MPTEPITITIRVGLGTELVQVEPRSATTFRVLESTWMNEDFGYDDVIEVEAEFHGAFPFVRVIEQSGLVRSTSILSQAAATNPKLATLLDEVVQAGGYWERAFGGALFIALPPNAGIDVNAALASL